MPPEQYDIGGYPDQPVDISGYPDQPQQQQPEKSLWDSTVTWPNAVRMAGSSAADFLGGAAAAAFPPLAWATYPAISFAGGYASEAGARMMEGQPFNNAINTVEGTFNLVPGPNIPGARAGLGEIAKYGVKQAGYGAVQGLAGTYPRSVAETGSWESPPLAQYGAQTGMGAVVGGATGLGLAGGSRLLRGQPRIEPGAGAENIDITPPPPNLKQIGSGSTSAPPPPIEAAPPPPPGAAPMTSMDPSVDVSINDPARMAELKAQGYIFVGLNDNNARFVRPDLMSTTHGEPTPSPVQDMRTTQDPNHISVQQVIQEFGDPVRAVLDGHVEMYNDGAGALGYRRIKPFEPPAMEEPPIESYDIDNGETPFTDAKDPLKDVPPLANVPEPVISEAEVEARYGMPIAQAVQEGLVERVVQNGETGYVVLQGELGLNIGGFRHIGDPRPPTAANETPNEQEIRAYLSRMLGRPATDDEVARAIDRQARTGEFTGRVAPFPPPDILAMRGDDLGNVPTSTRGPEQGPQLPSDHSENYHLDYDHATDEIIIVDSRTNREVARANSPSEAETTINHLEIIASRNPFRPHPIGELPGFMREGNVGEPSNWNKTLEELEAEGALSPGGRYDPMRNYLGEAVPGIDKPRPQPNQGELPFGPFGGTSMKGLPDDVDFLMRQMQNPSQVPEGPLPQQLGLGIDPGGGKPRMTDMEASIDPTTGKRYRPISGGSDVHGREPEWYNHPDRIGGITDPKQADAVDQYWHERSMERFRAGDMINGENYATLADLAKERYDFLTDPGSRYEINPIQKSPMSLNDIATVEDAKYAIKWWDDAYKRAISKGDTRGAEGYLETRKRAEDILNNLLPPGHTDEGGTRFIDLNQAIKRDTGLVERERLKDIEKRVDKDGFARDKYRLPDGTIVPVDATATKGLQTTDFTMRDGKIVKMEYVGPLKPDDKIDPKTGRVIEDKAKTDATKARREFEDMAEEVAELLERNQNPKSLIEEIRYRIMNATDTKTALRNLSDIRAHVDSATNARVKAIFENLYNDAFNVYHQTIGNARPRMPRSSAEATAHADDAFGRADELIDDGKVSEADKLIADEVIRLNKAGFASHAQELAADWNAHVDHYYNVDREFQDEFSQSFRRWEQKQNEPYAQGQLDLPLGRYETGVPRGYEPSMQRPRNELGQFITAAEAAKQQQDIPGLVSRSGVKARPETIVTPGIRGGSGEGEAPIPPNRIVEINAPRPTDPPVQPPGNVPPDQVPPGSRPPPPDEPPASVKKSKDKPPPTKSGWEQAYDAVRNLTTGLDISAPMRQGLPLISTKSWWTSWSAMLKAWGSQAAYDANQKTINDHYLFQSYILPDGKRLAGFGQRMGLRLIDELDHVEEVTASKWVEKNLPGFKASNRAYNAYLNKLRADTFTNLIEDAKRLELDPFRNEMLAREIAEFVNTATGAASIKMNVPAWMSKTREVSFEQSAKQLGYLLFSPRQTFSRARMLNPLTYTQATPYVRQQYMRAMIASAGAWGTIASAAAISGYADEVSLDPTSADFGKIRVGKTRLDAGGGFQQYLVATARLLSGTRTTAASSGGRGNTQVLGEGYQARTGLDVAQMFISNKLHPLTKFAYDFLAASEYQPFQTMDKIAQIAIPLYMQDAYEIIMQDRPEILPMLFPAAIGMGTQTYEAGEATSRIVPEKYDFKYTGGERPFSDMWRR